MFFLLSFSTISQLRKNMTEIMLSFPMGIQSFDIMSVCSTKVALTLVL